VRLIQGAGRRVGAGGDVERQDGHARRVERSDAFGNRRIERQAHIDSAESIQEKTRRLQKSRIGRVWPQLDARSARALARARLLA
jgi:hypothetical protein